ncbi:MAG: hypothetical protein MK110_11090 [Fuerstiella sp.]|nr:hypothetical protein [Fuerstiella sp.]
MVLQIPDSSLRVDILTGRRVIVAPGRSQRPGAVSSDPDLTDPAEGNPFVQGNESHTPNERLALRQADSLPNTTGWLIRVVPNQFPSVFSRCDNSAQSVDGPFKSLPLCGIHEIVVESPVTHRRLTELSVAETARILMAWQRRVRDLEQHPQLKSITIFRNEGFSAGASLPHVHSQILATNVVPPQTATRLKKSSHHRNLCGNRLLQDLCTWEVADGSRIVFSDPQCLVLCPYAGRVSWQMRIVPRQSPFDSFSSCTDSQLINVAGQLHAAAAAIDRCAGQLAMNLLLVQPPIENKTEGWFLDLMPRSARMAGYELATDVDVVSVAPEAAAALLREQFQFRTAAPKEVVLSGYRWYENRCGFSKAADV